MTLTADHLRFAQAIDGFGQCVDAGITNAPNTPIVSCETDKPTYGWSI